MDIIALVLFLLRESVQLERASMGRDSHRAALGGCGTRLGAPNDCRAGRLTGPVLCGDRHESRYNPVDKEPQV